MPADPLPGPDEALRAALRTEVFRLRQRERRRVFTPTAWLGALSAEATFGPTVGTRTPPGPAAWPPPAGFGDGVRFDLCDRLVEQWPHDDAYGWVCRPGTPDLHDDDLAWHAALRHAAGAHGLTLTGFFAVTRFGWLDVLGGESRRWRRLRL